MPRYLKIENPGVAPKEAFTLLGATSTANSTNKRSIGKFGSGNKHGVSVCLRYDLAPVAFCGQLRLDFATRPDIMNTGLESVCLHRVTVKFSGKDETGRSKTSSEDLGWVLDYGAADWGSVDLAVEAMRRGARDFSDPFHPFVIRAAWVVGGCMSGGNRTSTIRRWVWTVNAAPSQWRPCSVPGRTWGTGLPNATIYRFRQYHLRLDALTVSLNRHCR